MNISIKQIITYTIVLAFAGSAVAYSYNYYIGIPKVLSANSSKNLDSIFAPLTKKIYGRPAKLIAENKFELSVVPVGTTEDDFMETPSGWNDAGWWESSAKTDEPGNIVINGHYDNNYGQPAAFWQLKNFKVGDKLTVVGEFGRFFKYSVTEIYYVDIKASDRYKIFRTERGAKTMTLITCSGVWQPEESTYNKRLIVRLEELE